MEEENRAQFVVRITPGDVTEFAVPTAAHNNLGGIVTGSDGNLWFTGGDPALVGHVAPDGADATIFPIRTATARRRLTPGLDGNLWFSYGRSTPDGNFIPFTVPDADMTTGPDGNIWFTDFSHNQIGRLEIDSGN